MSRRRALIRSVGVLAWITLLTVTILAPPATVDAAEPVEPWDAEIWIMKTLDRDGDIETDDDRGPGGEGWTFSAGLVGSVDAPTAITDEESFAWLTVEQVTTRKAQVQIAELAEDAELIGASCWSDEGEVTQALDGRTLTIDIARNVEGRTWYCEFINKGDFATWIPIRIRAMVDKDGDPATKDWKVKGRWTYDIEVDGAQADVERIRTRKGRADFGIAVMEAGASVRITERARDGWTLLHAFCVYRKDDTIATREDRTLSFAVDRDAIKAYTCRFVHVRDAVAPTATPTATPTGDVKGSTAKPGVTLPPTDTLADRSPQPGSPLAAVLAIGSVGLVALALTPKRPRRRPR